MVTRYDISFFPVFVETQHPETQCPGFFRAWNDEYNNNATNNLSFLCAINRVSLFKRLKSGRTSLRRDGRNKHDKRSES